MSTFDEQTDFSFLGISVEEPVKTVKSPKNWGTESMSITLQRNVSEETRNKLRNRSNHGQGHTGKKHSEQARAKMSAKAKIRVSSEASNAKRRATLLGRSRPDNCKPMMTPNGVYPSMKAVVAASGKAEITIRKWMKKWPKHYYYITKEST